MAPGRVTTPRGVTKHAPNSGPLCDDRDISRHISVLLGKTDESNNLVVERTCQFLELLDEVRLAADLEGFEQYLYNMVLSLSSPVDLFRGRYDSPGNPITDEEWEDAFVEGLMVNRYANLVLGDRHKRGCQILALKLQETFLLRHAIEKVTYLPRHIDTLLRFADSPGLRPALQYSMFVSPIPKQTRTLRPPALREEWKFFLGTACGEHDDDGLEASATSKLSHVLTGTTSPHLAISGSLSSPAVPAASGWKPSMYRADRSFILEVRNGKWYGPCGAPTVEESLVEEASLEKKKAEKILKEYRGHLGTRMVARKRGGSESRGASSSGASVVHEPCRLEPSGFEPRQSLSSSRLESLGGGGNLRRGRGNSYGRWF
ncbi:hypothetical protein HOY82DRAFT_597616 [Tuber indicum]|nr:hypothetical protein HOY82DRAFT_597616 [Tuber indicum]